MKDVFPGQINRNGFSTIEMLIALAIISLSLTAVVLAINGTQIVTADSQTNMEALHKAQAYLESKEETARNSFSSVTADATPTADTDPYYSKQLLIPSSNITQCQKEIISSYTWTGTNNRSQYTQLSTNITDVPQMLALGGACDTNPPTATWNPPATWSCDDSQGKPTGLAVLNRVVYMTFDKAPFLKIANTNNTPFAGNNCQGQATNMFVTFANGFADTVQLNDVAVAKIGSKIYVFLARDNKDNQLGVVDVTDMLNPGGAGKTEWTYSLAGVDTKGSFPQGFRVFYYDQKVYITVRETKGPELHVFDASDPTKLKELGNGTELNRTVEDFIINKQVISGATHYFAYMATDKNSSELSIFDVTDPTKVKELDGTGGQPNAEPSLSGNQDGSSIFLVGNTLYLGRLSGTGPDLYSFNVANPLSGSAVPTLASKDIGTAAVGLAVSGNFAFVATSQNQHEFQVFKSSDLSSINLSFNFPNIINNGVAYENNWVYVSSQANGALRILYSPN